MTQAGDRAGSAKRGRAAVPAADPRVKTRIRSTRIAAGLLLLVLLFVAPVWGRHGVLPELLRWGGYAALVVGVMGRVWCSAYIGGRKSQIVVDVGPYSVMRNPLYLFSFVGLLGIGLVSGMLSVALALAIAFSLYYRRVVAGEEAFLADRHDAAFDDYLQRVPRWIPAPRLYREATAPMGLPRNVLLTIIESSAFFLAFPLFALIAWLQSAGMLPVLLRLP